MNAQHQARRARRAADIALGVARRPFSLLKGTVAYLEANGRIGALPTVYPFALFPAAGRCPITLQALDSAMGGVRLSELAILSAIAAVTRPRMVFEFGTLDGRTTLNLALNTPDDCAIYTLDLPEDQRALYDASLVARGHVPASERPSPGGRRVGDRFAAHPLGRKITQLCGDSRGFDFSAFYGRADFIFIDANHDYEYVKADSAAALSMLSERGTIVWHDYPNSLGVSECLSELKSELPLLHFWETTLACYRRRRPNRPLITPMAPPCKKPLLLATANLGVQQAHAAAGLSPRSEDVLAARLLEADVADYGLYDKGLLKHLARPLEGRLHVDLSLALAGAARGAAHSVIVSTSQKVGIPICLFQMLRARHTPHVLGLKGTTPRQIRYLRWTKLLQRVQAIVTLSSSEIPILTGHLGVRPERIHFLPTPVDHVFFRPQARRADNFILSVGLTGRDYRTLLRAIDGTGIPLTVVVGTRYYDGARALGAGRLPREATLCPAMSPAGIRDLYGRCRFVVVPLREAFHTPGSTVVTEAMAMSRAVIASHIAGMSDYVRDGESGLLVRPGDAAGLRRAILELWQERERAEAMGTRGRERIDREMNIDTYVEQWTRIIEAAAKGGTRPGPADGGGR